MDAVQYPDPNADVGAGADDEQQANSPEPQEQASIPLPSYPEITDIEQIFNLEAVRSLPLHNDHPVSRLTIVFTAKLTSYSIEHNDLGQGSLPNRFIDSFLAQSTHFLHNLTAEDVAQIVYIMYGEWTPPLDIITEHISLVRSRLSQARDALLKNDPQLAMSILYNHKIENDAVQFWIDDNNGHVVNEGDLFGVNADTIGTTPFLMLDSAYRADRFLCLPDLTSTRVHTPFSLGTQPDGFLEDVPHDIIMGTTNRNARIADMITSDHFSTDINTITSSPDLYDLGVLHMYLNEYIKLWTSRSTNEHFTNPNLPPPRIPGSMNYHRRATPTQMLRLLSDRCELVRVAHDLVDKEHLLPQVIKDFSVAHRTDEEVEELGVLLDNNQLEEFVRVAE